MSVNRNKSRGKGYMLINLHVKNIALIDEIDVEFTKGLNILTGETGAGKSILMGAVNLALGKKMTSGIIGKFGDHALVELIFSVDNPGIRKILEEKDIVLEDDQIILSRKVMDGRSICKINSETCTTGRMKEVASLLLDIHGQHEHQKLLSQEHQLAILDEFSGPALERIKAETESVHKKYKALQDELAAYQLDEEQRRRELSFLAFEIDEIEKADLKPDEDLKLEKKYRKLLNGRKIVEALTHAHDYIGYENRNQAGEQVSMAIREVAAVQEYDEQIDSVHRMLLDIESMLNDCNRELSSYLSNLSFSEKEFQEIDQRLNFINGLKSKYGSSIDEIYHYQAKQQKEQEKLVHFEERKNKLTQELAIYEAKLKQVCGQLTDIRKESAKRFEEQLKAALSDLNFANIDFEIVFSSLHKFTKNGKDTIEFLISTNPGENKRPLGKVVSGGELSRIMLAVKTLIADMEDTETQIFDEIDTGISGRTAQKVAQKLEFIGRKRQILCITHLPQIAAMSDAHYEIRKNIGENVATTQIYRLNESESIDEIARILGGAQITDSVRTNAKEMKDLAQVHKNTRVKK